MTDETQIPVPATPEAAAPAPASPTPAEAVPAQAAGQDLHASIEGWFVKHFHDNILSQDTEFFNLAHAAKEKLHAACTGGVHVVGEVVDHWLGTHFAVLSSRVPVGGEGIISTAADDLKSIVGGETK